MSMRWLKNGCFAFSALARLIAKNKMCHLCGRFLACAQTSE